MPSTTSRSAGTWSARKGTPISELGGFPSQNWFHQNRPTALHNGMIAPLGELAVQGAIWYQGESNANEETQPFYKRRMKALIRAFRRDLKTPELRLRLPLRLRLRAMFVEMGTDWGSRMKRFWDTPD